MATLQGALDELITVIDAVSGVNWAPADPPGNVPVGPTAVVYASTGRLFTDTPETYRGLHNVEIALIMPEGTLPQQVQAMLPLLEPVVAAIITHRNGQTSSHYSTFSDINYVFGPINWGGQLHTGFIFTIQDLKIRN